MKHVVLVFVTGLLLAMTSGCGLPDWWLGAKEGVLFQGLDNVGPVGEPVQVSVSLRGGKYAGSLSDYTVFFDLDGQCVGASKTDANGLAYLTRTFDSPGLYAISARLDPAEVGHADVPTCEVIAGAFDPQARFAVVDLDKTLVASGFDRVLLGDPDPMPHSRDVLDWLAQSYQIIYLTHRPEQLAKRSRMWLAAEGYPPGPLLVSSSTEFLEGSEAFKTGRLEVLKQSFHNIIIGVGDKISDAIAYHDNGLRSFVIIQTESKTADELRELADELGGLPEQVQVVTDWRQVRLRLEDQGDFGRPVAQRMLRELADRKEPSE